MYTSSAASHKYTGKSSQFRKQFKTAALRVLFNRALQAMEETADDCENTFLHTTNFHRFQLHLFNFFCPQIIDQIQFDLITMIFYLLNQNISIDTIQ